MPFQLITEQHRTCLYEYYIYRIIEIILQCTQTRICHSKYQSIIRSHAIVAIIAKVIVIGIIIKNNNNNLEGG